MNLYKHGLIALLLFFAVPLLGQTTTPFVSDEIELIQRQLENQQRENAYNQLIENQAALLGTPNQTAETPQTTTSQKPQGRKSTLYLESHLRSKLIGMEITYFHQDLETMMAGDVIQIYRKNDKYYAMVANAEQTAGNMVRVHFVKDFQAHARRGSDLMSKDDNYSGKQLAFDSEKRLGEMMQPLLGKEGTASQLQFPPRTTNSFRDIVSKADVESELVEVIEPSTKDRIKSRVIVYENRVRMLDGTPLSLIFEKE